MPGGETIRTREVLPGDSRDGQSGPELAPPGRFLGTAGELRGRRGNRRPAAVDRLSRLSRYRPRRNGPGSAPRRLEYAQDRKSTRLNSSHPSISYAVFCLKKKKKTKLTHYMHE